MIIYDVMFDHIWILDATVPYLAQNHICVETAVCRVSATIEIWQMERSMALQCIMLYFPC